MINRKLLIPALLCASINSVVPQSNINHNKENDKEQRSNILFILSDDHTSQSWGVYGGVLANYVQNENINRLAQEGCVMDKVFCTNSISVPSRASIFTGAYSHKNGMYILSDALYPEADNIAKRIQDSGYQTALFGKWHLKKEPSGFDSYSVFHDQGEYFDPLMKSPENWVDADVARRGEIVEGFSTDIVTDKTINWIKNSEKNNPFMVMCHFKATHEPWDYPEMLKHLSDDDVEFPEPANMYEFGTESSGRTFTG